MQNLQKKSEELTKTFQSLIQTKDKDKNSAEVLESLLNLQSNIINKKNMIDQKTSKIESKSFIALHSLNRTKLDFFYNLVSS